MDGRETWKSKQHTSVCECHGREDVDGKEARRSRQKRECRLITRLPSLVIHMNILFVKFNDIQKEPTHLLNVPTTDEV